MFRLYLLNAQQLLQIIMIIFVLIGLFLGIILSINNSNFMLLIECTLLGLIVGLLLGNITTRGFEIKIGFKDKK